MAICPECRPCLERLVELTAAQATPDPALQRQARQAALAILAREFVPAAIPAGIANRMHRVIMAVSGNDDPFAARKAAATDYLRRRCRELAGRGEDDLESLLKLAALGNAVDFFRGEAEVTREFASPPEFGISELIGFLRLLQGPAGLLLFLADNAGEQFFDYPLVAHLRRRGW